MILSLLLCIIVVLIFFLYIRWSILQNIWKEKGIPYVKPYPLIGNMMENIRKKKSFAEIIRDVCFELKNEPLVGFFNFMKPVLIINDPDYAEIVLIKEFSSFMNRGEDLKLAERRPLDRHLFFIGGSEWKAVRSKLAPVFTTGKLKGMLLDIERIFDKTFYGIDNVGVIDLKDIIEKFTLRVRASCVFSIDLTNSENETEFINKVKSMSKMTVTGFIHMLIALWLPKQAKKWDISIFGSHNEQYFVDILLDAFKKRAQSNAVKHDFVQTSLELKNVGKVEVKNWTQDDNFLKLDDTHSINETVEMTDDILVAQSFIFLVAGLDTLVSTLTMLFIELSQNSRVLGKLREEVDNVINSHKQLSYQALKEMDYLELCIKETLRMHSPAEFNVRHCCRSYTFPNGVTVDKGSDVFIPNIKFHMDPAIFPSPQEFRPERFIDNFHPTCSYIPFGQGPRICIAMRFAMMEMKMFAAKLIYNFNFKIDPKMELPIKTDKWYFLRKNISPIEISFNSRDVKFNNSACSNTFTKIAYINENNLN